MTYSKAEIVKEYNEARNKKQQIRILADLNACPREDIIAILSEAGALKQTKTTRTTKTATKKTEPLPDIIINVLSDKLEQIDNTISVINKDIKYFEAEIAKRRESVKELESTYTFVADFMKGGMKHE